MKQLLCRGLAPVALLASVSQLVAAPSALVNPGFEEGIPAAPWQSTFVPIPGWRNYGPLAGDGSFFIVNTYNLGIWAQALALTVYPGFEYGFLPYPPLEGFRSIGLISSYPADALMINPQWGWSSSVGERTGESLFLGRAGISQEVSLPAGAGELTLLFAQPEIEPGLTGGSLVLRFDDQLLDYTVEDPVGPLGPFRLLRANLTPVAGQHGELRIGIEGRGFFVVDSIAVIPEGSQVGALVLVVLAAGSRRLLRAGYESCPDLTRRGDPSQPSTAGDA